jgi:hypothetical protein
MSKNGEAATSKNSKGQKPWVCYCSAGLKAIAGDGREWAVWKSLRPAGKRLMRVPDLPGCGLLKGPFVFLQNRCPFCVSQSGPDVVITYRHRNKIFQRYSRRGKVNTRNVRNMHVRRSQVGIVGMPMVSHNVLSGDIFFCHQTVAIFSCLNLEQPFRSLRQSQALRGDYEQASARPLAHFGWRITGYFVNVFRLLKDGDIPCRYTRQGFPEESCKIIDCLSCRLCRH